MDESHELSCTETRHKYVCRPFDYVNQRDARYCGLNMYLWQCTSTKVLCKSACPVSRNVTIYMNFVSSTSTKCCCFCMVYIIVWKCTRVVTHYNWFTMCAHLVTLLMCPVCINILAWSISYLSTDVASRVFTQCILPVKENKSLEYDYYFLEEHIKQKVDEAVSTNNSRRTPPIQTPGTQVTTQAVHSTGDAPATTQTTQVTTQVTGIQSGTEATTSFTNQLAATNPVVTQTSDPASETPWWLKYKDPKKTEKQDDPPSHPLELMVGYIYSI